eukprot:scaffold4429_cov81-Skeletonema_dohrnii-CCMP3373.AAC.19
MQKSTAAATNTTIIEAAYETITVNETIMVNETIIVNETIASNDKTVIAGTFIGGSRVEYDGDANNSNTTFFAGRNHGEDLDEGQTAAPVTPTVMPTYAPTPLTRAPATPIPTYSPTEVPTTTPSPPTPSPSITSTIKSSTSAPISAPTPSPSVSFITGTGTGTAIPEGLTFEAPTAPSAIVSSIIPSPTPNPTWNIVIEGGSTAIPTSFWRRKNKRNLRHTEDQDED